MTNSNSATYIKPEGSIRDFRLEIFRLLQNMTGSVTIELKQIS